MNQDPSLSFGMTTPCHFDHREKSSFILERMAFCVEMPLYCSKLFVQFYRHSNITKKAIIGG